MKKRESKKAKQKHEKGRPISPALIEALNHPIRRQVLRSLTQQPPGESPTKMARLVTVGLPRLAYHMRVLCDLRVTRRIGERPIRGATEHFYVSDVADSELVDEILRNTEKDDESLKPDARGRKRKGPNHQ